MAMPEQAATLQLQEDGRYVGAVSRTVTTWPGSTSSSTSRTAGIRGKSASNVEVRGSQVQKLAVFEAGPSHLGYCLYVVGCKLAP